MSFGSPSPPDPTATANAQQGYNVQAAQAQQKGNMINQQTPFGSLNYANDPNAPSGYSANVNLNPQMQSIVNSLQGAGSSLASNAAGMYGSGQTPNPQTTMDMLNKWQQANVQPIFKQQESNLTAQLQNQGLTPGSEAYNNAMNLQARNEGDVNNAFFAQNEPTAFSQSVQQYQLPLQTLGGLSAVAQGQQPNFQQTPTAQVQPANYSGIAEQNYQQQLQQQQSMMNGLFGIPTALAGGWARGGFTNPFGTSGNAGNYGGTGGGLGGLY